MATREREMHKTFTRGADALGGSADTNAIETRCAHSKNATFPLFSSQAEALIDRDESIVRLQQESKSRLHAIGDS
jgi:hypothetical protein